jgi:hypothetical protein
LAKAEQRKRRVARPKQRKKESAFLKKDATGTKGLLDERTNKKKLKKESECKFPGAQPGNPIEKLGGRMLEKQTEE